MSDYRRVAFTGTREGTTAPTFEERYGPWICMGCGWAHKLGDTCPGDENADPAPRAESEGE